MFEKIKKVTSALNAKVCVASATVTSMLCPVAFAGGATTTKKVSEGTIDGADEIMGTIVGYIASIFRYIGILLMVWSIGMLVLAFKNEDADSKSRAMMMLVVSLILITLKSIVNAVLKASGASFTLA